MERSRSSYGQTDVWDKIWRDRRGRIVIFQVPNVWLIGWAVLDVISILVSSHTTSNVFYWLATVMLGIWAILELTQGVNYFRRGLGAVVLLLVILSVFKVGL